MDQSVINAMELITLTVNFAMKVIQMTVLLLQNLAQQILNCLEDTVSNLITALSILSMVHARDVLLDIM